MEIEKTGEWLGMDMKMVESGFVKHKLVTRASNG